MKQCKICTITERHDAINATGVCSDCRRRGHHRRYAAVQRGKDGNVTKDARLKPKPKPKPKPNTPTPLQIEVFKALVEHRQLSAASEQLGRSKQAIMSHVYKLEAHIGGEIYERRGEKKGYMRLTPAAWEFWEAVS